MNIMKMTPRNITIQISHIEYKCPHCEETISYDTDGIPTSNQCHKCMKEIDFEDKIL